MPNTLIILMWKHLMVRKHKFHTTFMEFSSTIAIFVLIYHYRSSLLVSPDERTQRVIVTPTLTALDSFKEPSVVIYAPKNRDTSSFMEGVGHELDLYPIKDTPEDSESGFLGRKNQTMMDLLQSTDFKQAVVQFQNVENFPGQLQYTIKTIDPHSYNLLIDGPGTIEIKGSIYESILRLQWAMDKTYLTMLTGANITQKLYFQAFPHVVKYSKYDMPQVVQLFEIAGSMGIFLPFAFTMGRLIEERATGLMDLICMTGVSKLLYMFSHFLNCLPGCFIYSFGGTICFKWDDDGGLLHNSNAVLIFLILALYSMATIVLAMLCSFITSRKEYGITLGIVVFVVVQTVVSFLDEKALWPVVRTITGLLPHIPFEWFCRELENLEISEEGVNYSTMTISHTSESRSVLLCYIMCLIQIVVMALLVAYLTFVRPGPFGSPKPWNFLFQTTKEKIKHREPVAQDPRYFESPPQGKEVGISIKHVSKVYRDNLVLNDVTFDIYKGEITVLLGVNGAGKTTLMSIITGMIPLSEGLIVVNGKSGNHTFLKREMGLCPQHNLFVVPLTVLEHVVFFGMLKGQSCKQARESGKNLLKELGLDNKAHAGSGKLSGGMKRRLQLACALSGDTDVLVLDEPTSGLDVETRRELWDLLLKLRGNRTVLLSTHFMEEADALGDRIAALNLGVLVCHATPLFLKSKLGSEHVLSIYTFGSPNESKITPLVKQYIPDANLRDFGPNFVTYDLPSKSSASFPGFFQSLESQRSALAISNIGVGTTTIEEVFIKLRIKSDRLFSEEKGERVVPHMAKLADKKSIKYNNTFSGFKINSSTIQIFYPLRSPHIAGVTLNLASNTILRQLTPWADEKVENFKINASYQPVTKPISLQSQKSAYANFTVKTLVQTLMALTMWSVYIFIAFFSTISNVGALLTKEVQSGTRRLHIMAGCPAVLHWGTRFFFHMFLYTVILVIPIMASIYIIDFLDIFGHTDVILCFTLIFLVSLMSWLSFVYILSFALKDTPLFIAISIVIVTGMVIGLVDSFRKMADFGRCIWPLRLLLFLSRTFLPTHAAYAAGFKAIYIATINEVLRSNFVSKLDTFYEWKDTKPLPDMCQLLLQFFYQMVIVIAAEQGLFNNVSSLMRFNIKPKIFYDKNTRAQSLYVEDAIADVEENTKDIMLVNKVYKTYVPLCHKPVNAVNGISFSVEKGECFGLLGVNGAGKSTTFKMMVAETGMTRGQIWTNGYFLTTLKEQYLKSLSYCPQFLGIDTFLTAHQNLTLLLILRGVTQEEIGREVRTWINIVGLEQIQHRPVSTYSGGNARRASTACALCSAAPLTLLDEPTAGVDVFARRRVWYAVKKALQAKRSVIITSHSMDEMEALCDRVAILKAGEICAFGTVPNLRAEHAAGFSLRMKITSQVDDTRATQKMKLLKKEIQRTFKCTLKDEHQTMLNYHIDETMPYSELFGKLEELKYKNSDLIQDYTVNETTLEEVFLSFARDEHRSSGRARRSRQSK